MLTVNGYRLFRLDRPHSSRQPKGYGGVAVFVRDCISCEVVPTPETGITNSNLEILWVLTRIGKNSQILFASVYRVPMNSTTQITADLEDFEYQLQHMMVNFPNATVVIAGDFNMCLFKSGGHDNEHQLLSLLNTYGIQVTNRTVPTYRPASSLLDIVGVSKPELCQRVDVIRCHYGGPHDITRVVLDCRVENVPTGLKYVLRRSLSKVDTATFCEALRHTDWSPVWSVMDQSASGASLSVYS